MNTTITSHKLISVFAILAMTALLVIPFSSVSATSVNADLSLQKECVSNDGKIAVDAPNGLDSYKLIDTNSQSEIADNPDGVSSGTTITIDGLADGDYRFEGTLGTDFETIVFSIDCDDICEPSPENDLSVLNFDSQAGSVTIKNNSDSCAYDVGIASYKGFEMSSDEGWLKISNQELFDDKTTRLQANEKKTLDIDVPDCAYQIDAFYGDLIKDFSAGDRYGDRKLAHSHENTDNLCGDDKPDPEPEPDLSLSQQCVYGSGKITVSAPNGLDSYKLFNTDTLIKSGGNVAVGDTIEIDDLDDGNYRFEGELGNNSETRNFSFDCYQEKDPDITILDQRCVHNDGVVEIDTPNGLDSYKLINTTTGNTVVDDTDGTSAGFITVSDLADGNYRFEATIDGNSETLNFTVDCDEEPVDNLTGSCSVSSNEVEPGEKVTFSSDASGGNSPYSFSWELEGSNDDDNTKNVTTSYSHEGTYDGTVTITDDNGEEITRTCHVRVEEESDDDNGDGGGGGDRLDPRDDDDDDGDVRGDRDEDFSVQCLPESSVYKIGEEVLFEATIDGDIDEDDVEFNWSGDGSLDETGAEATAQYTTHGVKTVEVEAEHDGDTESDTCYVQIGEGQGVTLDQVPYTGPGDTAKTLGFIATIILLAMAGGYALIKRRAEDGIPVGIPTDHS